MNKTLKTLKKDGNIPNAISGFTFQVCVDILYKHNPNLISEDIDLKVIKKAGDIGTHLSDNPTLEKAGELNQKLIECLNWFIENCDEQNRYKTYITSEVKRIKDTPAKEGAAEIAKFLKEEIKELNNTKDGSEEIKFAIEQFKSVLKELENIVNEIVEKTAEKFDEKQTIHTNKIIERIDGVEKKHKKTYGKLWKILLFIALLLCGIWATLHFTSTTSGHIGLIANKSEINGVPFDTTIKDSYNILLFPFEPLEECQFKKTDIERTIVLRLNEMNERDNLGLQIYFDSTTCISGYSDADSIGRKLMADLVIWGELYQQCENDTKDVSLRFANISFKNYAPGIRATNETEITKITSTSEIREGKLQMETDYVVYWVAGYNNMLKRNYSRAVSHFKKIKNLNIYGELMVANCYRDMEKWDEAKLQYEKIINTEPYFAEARNNYAILLGEHYKKYRESKEQYEFILHNKSAYLIGNEDSPVYPKWSMFCLNYARLLFSKLNDKEEAEKYFLRAFEYDSTNLLAHADYGVFLYEVKKDTLNAFIHLASGISMNPDKYGSGTFNITAYRYLAHILMIMNKYELSETIYKMAIIFNPNDPGFHFDYAYLLDKKINDTVNARKHYEKAIELYPNLAIAHVMLSSLIKDPTESAQHIIIAMGLDSTINNVVLSTINNYRNNR